VTEDGGRAAFDEIASHEPVPTAVMAMSDMTAIGIMAAALDAGLELPDDLSIVGFDDIPATAWTTPRLTTVHQPIREKGRRAAHRLIGAIRSGSDHRPVVELLPTRLVVRGSSAAPRTGSSVVAVGGGVDGG
jgi:DNA-binding LacI/PurR family transcriptional regulator